MTAVSTELPVSPYKGLANYTEEDAALFFGRDREREVIIANLKARRLTLLYGDSGVGKSSLLRAGVMADLSETARRNFADIGTPEHVPVVFSAWSDEPVAGLAAAIRAAVQTFADVAAQPPDSGSLADVIAWAAAGADAHLLIILDQFEEYFLYHQTDRVPGTFAAELPDILNRPGVQANVLVSIREDALAKLDVFKRDVPRLFDSSLRVHHLDAAAAREAIERPVERYNALAAADERVVLEAGLVAAVIDQVRSGRVVLEQTGQGTLERGDGPDDGGSDRIETPYLQLVMARLWDVEEARGSPTMRVATLAELGGAQEIVRTHLDAALRGLDPQERDTAASLFHQLVTPSGTKIAHAVPDLAEYARRPEPEVRDLLEKLSRPETRILRPVPPPPGEEGPERFEIFHDVLAPSVLAWRTRQTAARRLEEQRRAARAATRRRLLRLVGLVGAVGFAAVIVLAILANAQRNEAQQQEALARGLAAKSAQAESESLRLARLATRRARSARHNRGLAEDEARRANRLLKVNRRQAREAKGLAATNQRIATAAQALAADNRRQADRARAAAAGERVQRDRATLLAARAARNAADAREQAARADRNAADANREAARADENAADARREAARADNEAALAREQAERADEEAARANFNVRFMEQAASILGRFAPSAFRPGAFWRWRDVDETGLIFSIGVIVPEQTDVRAACSPTGCAPFQSSSGDRADAVPIKTIAGRRLQWGTVIDMHATSPNRRTFWRLRLVRPPESGDSPVQLERSDCRPPGSSSAPTPEVPRCP